MARCNAPSDTRDQQLIREHVPIPSTSNSNRAENNKRKYDGLVDFHSGLMCTLCNQQHFRRYISAFRHITGESHREHLHKYLKISPNNRINRPEGLEEIPFEKFLLCTICNLKVPLDRIDCHISTIDHLTNGKKVVHRVSTFEFKCQLCNQRLIGYERVMSHLRNVNHQKRKARKLNDTKSRRSFELPEGIISDRHHSFWCRICSCSVKATETAATDHASRDSHRRRLREWRRSHRERSRKEPSKDETRESDETTTATIKISASQSRAAEHRSPSSASTTSRDEPNPPQVLRNDLPEGIERLRDEEFLLCTICCSVLPPSDMTQHVARISHRTSGRKIITRVSENLFNCDVCHCTLRSWKQVLVHSADEKHREKKYLEMLNGYERPVIPQHPPEENASDHESQVRHDEEVEESQTSASAIDYVTIKEEEFDDSEEDFIPLQSLMDEFQIKEEDVSDEGLPSNPQSESSSGEEAEEEDTEDEKEEENHENQASKINGVVESSELEPIQQNVTHGLSLPTGISPICHKGSLFCLFCDCIFLLDDTEDHVATIKHREKLEKGIIEVSEYEYLCDICSCRLWHPTNARQHLEGMRHGRNRASRDTLYSQFSSEEEAKDNHDIQSSTINEAKESLNLEPIQRAASHGISLPLGISPFCDVESLFCAYCDSIFLPVETDDHVATIKHQEKLKKGSIEISKYRYSCDLCICCLDTPKNVRTHLQGKRHREKVKSKDSQLKSGKRSNNGDHDDAGRLDKRRRICYSDVDF